MNRITIVSLVAALLLSAGLPADAVAQETAAQKRARRIQTYDTRMKQQVSERPRAELAGRRAFVEVAALEACCATASGAKVRTCEVARADSRKLLQAAAFMTAHGEHASAAGGFGLARAKASTALAACRR